MRPLTADTTNLPEALSSMLGPRPASSALRSAHERPLNESATPPYTAALTPSWMRWDRAGCPASRPQIRSLIVKMRELIEVCTSRTERMISSSA